MYSLTSNGMFRCFRHSKGIVPNVLNMSSQSSTDESSPHDAYIDKFPVLIFASYPFPLRQDLLLVVRENGLIIIPLIYTPFCCLGLFLGLSYLRSLIYGEVSHFLGS